MTKIGLALAGNPFEDFNLEDLADGKYGSDLEQAVLMAVCAYLAEDGDVSAEFSYRRVCDLMSGDVSQLPRKAQVACLNALDDVLETFDDMLSDPKYFYEAEGEGHFYMSGQLRLMMLPHLAEEMA